MGGGLSKNELHQALTVELAKNDDVFFVDKTTDAINGALDVLADAFQKDPMMCWAAGLDASEESTKNARLEASRYMLGFMNHDLLSERRGYSIGIGNDEAKLVGCMTLVPSSHPNLSMWDTIRMAIKYGMPPMAKDKDNVYAPNAMERLNAMSILDKKRLQHMDAKGENPKWIYLQTLGVQTEYQGKGKYGSKLLRFLQQTATTMNVPVYLETESKENEGLYQHFGFETLEEIELCVPGDTREDATLIMYLMRWKPPASLASNNAATTAAQ